MSDYKHIKHYIQELPEPYRARAVQAEVDEWAGDLPGALRMIAQGFTMGSKGKRYWNALAGLIQGNLPLPPGGAEIEMVGKLQDYDVFLFGDYIGVGCCFLSREQVKEILASKEGNAVPIYNGEAIAGDSMGQFWIGSAGKYHPVC